MQAFGDELDIWLAAENGMFLRHSSTKRDWINVMPEHMNMDWMESVQVRRSAHHNWRACTSFRGK